MRDVTVLATDAEHIDRIVESVHALEGVVVEHVSDRLPVVDKHGRLVGIVTRAGSRARIRSR